MVIHGSLATMALLILLGAITFAGIGLLVASRARTMEAVSGLMNLVMLPMWVVSGIFFPSDRFPEAAQPFIQALPLTPLINALRNVSMEGVSLASQWPLIAILAAWACGSRIENVLAYQAISGFLVEGVAIFSARKAEPVTSGAGLPLLFIVPTVGTSPRGKRKVNSDAGKCFQVVPLKPKGRKCERKSGLRG